MARKPAFDRAAWLEDRRRGIGGSDAAAIVGVDPWRSPIHVFQEKSGLIPIEPDEIERLEWGNILEGPIAERYSMKTGRTVRRNENHEICKSPDIPWLICTPDGEVEPLETDPYEGTGNLQIKTAHPMMRGKWEEEVPLHYQVQVQHEMAVMGHKWTSLPILFGNEKLEYIDIPRDDKFIGLLLKAEEKFWDYVQRGILPPIDESWDQGLVNEALKKLNPAQPTDQIVLDDEDGPRWKRNVEEAKEEIKRWEAVKSAYENKLLYAGRDAKQVLLRDGSIVKITRSNIKGGTYERKAHVRTTITFSQPK